MDCPFPLPFRCSPPIHLAGDRGRIISFSEFLAELTRQGKKLDEDQRFYVKRWLALEKPDHAGEFEKNLEYPVVFEDVRPSEGRQEPAEKEDKIRWMHADYLEKAI